MLRQGSVHIQNALQNALVGTPLGLSITKWFGSLSGPALERKIEESFQDFDKDGSGLLDRQEFEQALHTLGLRLSPDEFTTLWQETDIDCSGAIDLKEYTFLVKKYLNIEAGAHEPCALSIVKSISNGSHQAIPPGEKATLHRRLAELTGTDVLDDGEQEEDARATSLLPRVFAFSFVNTCCRSLLLSARTHPWDTINLMGTLFFVKKSGLHYDWIRERTWDEFNYLVQKVGFSGAPVLLYQHGAALLYGAHYDATLSTGWALASIISGNLMALLPRLVGKALYTRAVVDLFTREFGDGGPLEPPLASSASDMLLGVVPYWIVRAEVTNMLLSPLFLFLKGFGYGFVRGLLGSGFLAASRYLLLPMEMAGRLVRPSNQAGWLTGLGTQFSGEDEYCADRINVLKFFLPRSHALSFALPITPRDAGPLDSEHSEAAVASRVASPFWKLCLFLRFPGFFGDFIWPPGWHAKKSVARVLEKCWEDLKYATLVKMPCKLLLSLPLTHMLGRGLSLSYEMVQSRVKTRLFEAPEQRLARKLQHAAQHTHAFRGKVKSFGSGSDGGGGGGKEGRAVLMRQSTMVLKQEAVSAGLERKRNALGKRIRKHAEMLRMTSSASAAGSLLTVTRASLHTSLYKLAFVPPEHIALASIQVTFEGEEGVDRGGLFRDWIHSLSIALLGVESKERESGDAECLSHLLRAGPDAALLPAPFLSMHAKRRGEAGGMEGGWEALKSKDWNVLAFALGRLMALCMASGIALNLPLSRCMYKMLVGEEISAEDVRRIDPVFFEHRVAALLRPGGVAETEEILCGGLFFVGVAAEGDFGNEEDKEPQGKEASLGELLEGGRNIRVTEENKEQYVQLLVEHYLLGNCRRELALVLQGFYDIIPKSVLCGGDGDLKLRAIDVELLVTGLPGIDPKDWRKHTGGGMTTLAEHAQLLEWFWEVVCGMEVEDQAKVLAFACGNCRVPAAGFAALQPHFNLEVTGEGVDHLPTAHTCYNMLCMPKYTSAAQLQERLRKALDLDVGFGFL